jgi:two-component system, LytTR family, response regulator
MEIRALIVDDEGLDRELLANLLGEYCHQIAVVGEAAGVEEADKLIAQLQPDVVFLDIQMRGETGFDLLQKNERRSFLTVFTTGYDAYGIQAVKAGAFDYLLKPIDVDELIETQNRLLVALEKENPAPVLRIFHQGAHHLVRPEEIILMKAQGSYTRIYLNGNRQWVVSKNLKQLQEEANAPFLLKVHRSCVVNTRFIQNYRPSGNEGILMLENGEQVPISRAYKQTIREWLP